MIFSSVIMRHVDVIKNCHRFLTRDCTFEVTEKIKNIRLGTRKYCTKTYSGNAPEFQNELPKMSKPSMRTPKTGRDIDVLAILMLCIPVSTFCLGTWQVRRKKWKENLIEELMMKTNAPSIELPTDIENLKDLEYRKVRVKGQFDHSKEIYLGPRSCIVEGESKYNGQLLSMESKDSVGYYVVTPFELSGTKEKILVNRGWISFSKKNPKTRSEGQIREEVELEGIIRTTEPRQRFAPDDKLNVNVFITRNVEKMADFLGTKPIFIDATVESTVSGGPIGGQTRASLRNEHLSYIFTWYSLSAATSIMWYMKYIKSCEDFRF